MSHIFFLIVVGFVVWQWLGRYRRRNTGDLSQSDDASRSYLEADELLEEGTSDIAGVGEIGEAVAALFGRQGQELFGRVAEQALQDSELGKEFKNRLGELARSAEPANVEFAGAVTPPHPQITAPSSVRSRTKYLLDGADGHRQKIDRTAKLQNAMRGKGLCSAR